MKVQTQTLASKPGRIPAIDFTKGVLVLVMVLYHWLNYFVGPQGFFYVYLRFLPPSFICITGFLISHIYLAKYRIGDVSLPRRLAIRGIKILGVFVALNLLISGLSRGPEHVFDIFAPATLVPIYLTGNMTGGRLVAFYVLLPIGYLLIFSAVLLPAFRYFRYIFHAVCGLFLLTIFLLALAGYKNSNLELLSIGMLGVSIGYLPVEIINRSLRYPYAIVVAYTAYLAAITAWDVPYPMLIVAVLLTLVLIYWIGTLSGSDGPVQRVLILLGKYSLLGYIAQIAVLQMLRRGLLLSNPSYWFLGLSLTLAIALTLVTVRLTDRMRAKVGFVNRFYGAVFV